MSAFKAIRAKVGRAGERMNGFIEAKRGKIAVIGAVALMGAGVAGMATGDAQAVANTTETVKYYGLSTVGWIFAVFTLLFGVGTMWLRDYRLAILSGLALLGVVVISYLGI